MTVFVLFFVEIMAMRFATFGHDHDHDHADHAEQNLESASKVKEYHDEPSVSEVPTRAEEGRQSECPAGPYMPGDDHLGHSRDHETTRGGKTFDPESYAARMTALFILEFGVIFHSVFIGLTLAVSGAEFTTLYIVLTFHQTFEGLALGSRLGSMEWPKSKKLVPYIVSTIDDKMHVMCLLSPQSVGIRHIHAKLPNASSSCRYILTSRERFNALAHSRTLSNSLANHFPPPIDGTRLRSLHPDCHRHRTWRENFIRT